MQSTPDHFWGFSLEGISWLYYFSMTFLRAALAILLVCILSAGYFLYGKWQMLSEPHALSQKTITIAIPRGATFEDTLALLSREGIITDILPLRVYLNLTNSAPVVQAGSYQFQSPITPLGAVDVLRGGAHSDKITILEGWNRFDIAKAMRAVPALKLKTDTEALPLLSDVSLISDIDPVARNLEGYLYPDTYFIVERMTPKEVVKGMVTRFRKVWKEHLAQQAYERKTSIHEVVTVASLIETEAKLESERPKVASVIFNRMSKGMPLGIDSTIVYAAKIDGKWRNDGKVYQSDIDRRSPYNTRIFKGLPPGPVGSPGLSSLKAALNPETTTYLYYVRNPYQNNGAHNFYSSSAEFENGVTMLRNWEKKQVNAPAATSQIASPSPAPPAYVQNPLQTVRPTPGKPIAAVPVKTTSKRATASVRSAQPQKRRTSQIQKHSSKTSSSARRRRR
ncbi:MAG TPA: endolytic transglycosylase MltG [Candidatus Melainabacteria bacterium]|nr:endolytic transglycosylase MltG [Candidatus Melainabacteria bacterium]